MKRSRDRKKSKGETGTAGAVELSEQELGEAAGGGAGGGLYNTGGTLTLSDSTISGNRSTSGDGTDDVIVTALNNGGHVK